MFHIRVVFSKLGRTPRVTTILLSTPSVNSRNYSYNKDMALAPWSVEMPNLAHLSNCELSTLTKGAGPLPFQGLSSLQLEIVNSI